MTRVGMRSLTITMLAAVVGAGCGPGTLPDSIAVPVMRPAPPPQTAELVPAGTVLRATLLQPLGPDHVRTGDRFAASLDAPLVAMSAEIAIPEGAVFHGTVTGVAPAAGGDPAVVRLDLDQVAFDGRGYPFTAAILEATVQVGEARQPTRPADRAPALGEGPGTIILLGSGESGVHLPMASPLIIQSTQALELQ